MPPEEANGFLRALQHPPVRAIGQASVFAAQLPPENVPEAGRLPVWRGRWLWPRACVPDQDAPIAASRSQELSRRRDGQGLDRGCSMAAVHRSVPFVLVEQFARACVPETNRPVERVERGNEAAARCKGHRIAAVLLAVEPAALLSRGD